MDNIDYDVMVHTCSNQEILRVLLEQSNEIKQLKALITELADAFQKHEDFGMTDYDRTGIDVFELIQKARKGGGET